MPNRLAIARILARETLGNRGEVITDESIEREAGIIAKGLYVERAEDEISLTERVLVDSAQPAS